eukprot:3191680-Rhodomonas_salina.1
MVMVIRTMTESKGTSVANGPEGQTVLETQHVERGEGMCVERKVSITAPRHRLQLRRIPWKVDEGISALQWLCCACSIVEPDQPQEGACGEGSQLSRWHRVGGEGSRGKG